MIEELEDAVLGGVLQETVDELSGRSKRKWAVILLAFIVGGAVAAGMIRARNRRAAEITTIDTTTPDFEEQK